MASAQRRRQMDLMKLMMSDYDVTIESEARCEFVVNFEGPAETAYEGGMWKVQVALPAQYPFKSPSISFATRMYHPNVEERSGSVCLDVINQTWSPMFDLVNVFDSFLPQLLRYPNPTDPLNGEAAALMLKDPTAYAQRIREYVLKYSPGPAMKKQQQAKAKAKASASASSSAAAAAAAAAPVTPQRQASNGNQRDRTASASSAASSASAGSTGSENSMLSTARAESFEMLGDDIVMDSDDSDAEDDDDDDDMSVCSNISELSDD